MLDPKGVVIVKSSVRRPVTRGAYSAFVSYSHRSDRDLARDFQSDVERFGGRYPWSRPLRLYRDETNLAAAPDLWTEILEALSRSSHLLLMASPSSARSAWVPREVAAFVGARGVARLCIVLTEGRTEFTDPPGFAEQEQALGPATLEHLQSHTPLVVDLRPFRDPAQREPRKYLSAVATVVAFLSDRPKDEIFGEHIARRRNWVRVLAATVLVVCALAGFAISKTIEARAATVRAQAGEAAAKLAQRRAEQAANVAAIEAEARQASATAAERPEEAMLAAARAWRRIAKLCPHLDETVRAACDRARFVAAAALFSTANTAPGLKAILMGAETPVVALAAGIDEIAGIEETGRVLRWDARTFKLVSAANPPEAADPIDSFVQGGVVTRNGKGYIWSTGESFDLPVATEGYVRLSAERRYAAYLAVDGSVNSPLATLGAYLLDRESGASARRLGTWPYAAWRSRALAFSPDESQLFISGLSSEDEIVAWDVATGLRRPRSMRGGAGMLYKLAVEDSDEAVAGVSAHGRVLLWDKTGKLAGNWPAHVKDVAVLFDRAFTVNDGGSLDEWRSDNRVELATHRYAHRDGGTAIVRSPRGELVTAGNDKTVKVWDSVGRSKLERSSMDLDVAVLQPDRDGAVGVGRIDGQTAALRRFDSALAATEVRRFAADKATEPLAVLHGDQVLLATRGVRALHVLDTLSGARTPLEIPGHGLFRIQASPDGQHVVALGGFEIDRSGGGLWHWKQGTSPQMSNLLPGQIVSAFAFDRTSQHLVAAVHRTEIVGWSVSPLEEKFRRPTGPREVSATAVTEDGRWLAIGYFDGDVDVIDLHTPGTSTVTLRQVRGDIASIAFHPTERWIAIRSRREQLAVVDHRTGSTLFGRRSSLCLAEDPCSMRFNDAGSLLFVSSTSRYEVLMTSPDDWADVAESTVRQ